MKKTTTRKLYYENSYIFDFTAEALDIIKADNFRCIILDKTAFFPVSGGQLADSGYISGSEIFDVFEKDGLIYHKTRDKISFGKGSTVFCKINSDLRFKRMQAHSGEHIVSGLAHNMYGAENVGFHMDEDCVMTIDFDIPLTRVQISELEKNANVCVYKNLSVRAFTADREQAKEISFRSKKEIEGAVRIVEIAGVDFCACCAPHVKNTGEIGLIKILSSLSHRGGVRLTLICGQTAYEDYRDKYRQTLNIARLLCAKHGETDTAVKKLLEQNSDLRLLLSKSKKDFNRYLAASVEASPVICVNFENLSMSDLFEVTDFIKNKCEYCAMVFSGGEETGFAFCLYSERFDLKRLAEDMKKNLGGKCGGRGDIIQGTLKAKKEDIYKFFTSSEVGSYADA